MTPDNIELHALYVIQKLSPETIGKRFGVHGRTVRNWLQKAGIPRLGPEHLRKGVPALWNKGIKRTAEQIEKNRVAHLDRTPHNKGSGNKTFACEVCATVVHDKPYRRSKVCGEQCRDIRNSIMRGEGHWNFKGDNSGTVQRRRKWAEYKDWRNAVMKNANYTCEKCKKVGGKLSAHHKNSWTSHPDQRFLVENGACLCWQCHWSFHRIYGHKHSTISQYCKWITKY